MPGKQPILTLHWLEQSRAHRIAWLLEELNLDYNLKLYHRDSNGEAPEELTKIFPLGKAPILEFDFQNGEPTYNLCESGHIVNCMINCYDQEGLLKAKTEESKVEVDYYYYLSESSISENVTYLNALTKSIPKDESQKVISNFVTNFNSDFTYPQLKMKLSLLESKLTEESKKSKSNELYFVDDKLTGAEIILMTNVSFCFDSDCVDVDGKDYPLLSKWLNQLKKRPALLKANEKVETLGKGEYQIGF